MIGTLTGAEFSRKPGQLKPDVLKAADWFFTSLEHFQSKKGEERHEVPSFLKWGIQKLPARVLLMEMGGFDGYINRDTWDSYWNKIFQRTGREIRKLLAGSKDRLERHKLLVRLTTFLMNEFSIDDNFVDRHNFSIIMPHGISPEKWAERKAAR